MTQFPLGINDEVRGKKKNNTSDEYAYSHRLPNLFSRGSKSRFFFSLLFIPSSRLLIPKSHLRKNGGERKIVYFVKRDQFRAADFAVCVFPPLRFSEVLSRFLNPPPLPPHLPTKSQVGTSQKPTQFGSELAVFAHMRPRI